MEQEITDLETKIQLGLASDDTFSALYNLRTKLWNSTTLLPSKVPPRSTSWVWKGISNSFLSNDSFGNHIRTNLVLQVGDGQSIYFWTDIWALELSLKEKFLRIFALTYNKIGRISEFASKGATRWCWLIHLRRNLFDWEQPQWNELLVCLQNFNFSSLDRDVVRWKGSSDGTFSVRSLRKIIDKNFGRDPIWEDIVWRGFAPPKVEIFMWLVMWNRVPVRTELSKNGYYIGIQGYFSKPGMLQPKREGRMDLIYSFGSNLDGMAVQE
ncbi:hypothetical protein V6N12_014161 [Hibiscus sabdariffa]|uniref:Reverse transcriptase zinc-binding domain-containing protein n=1 Tax=Hibiscus sabdariffa TaxID=183260 RepID=A0ABR2DJB9_9ROSI